jgi:hypothetical protein
LLNLYWRLQSELILGLKECLEDCATVYIKSEVILKIQICLYKKFKKNQNFVFSLKQWNKKSFLRFYCKIQDNFFISSKNWNNKVISDLMSMLKQKSDEIGRKTGKSHLCTVVVQRPHLHYHLCLVDTANTYSGMTAEWQRINVISLMWDTWKNCNPGLEFFHVSHIREITLIRCHSAVCICSA